MAEADDHRMGRSTGISTEMSEPVVRRPVRVLPPELAERIAAGEVIDRPASIVRELVENSLDADARRIDILIEEGGIRRVRVRDDGVGIPREDLPLALRPHATSKIATYEDLVNLETLGFRGEALASMVAVADVTLLSRARGASAAYLVEARAGSVHETPRPASHPVGTTVEVRDLFYHLPARRRFLRAPATETRHVLEVVRRLAVSHPDVSFELGDGRRKLLMVLPAGEGETSARERLGLVAGTGFAAGALFLESATNEGLRLRGWIIDPRLASEDSEPQWWSVNGRPVRDRMLHHAVRRAFEEFLHGSSQPRYVLELTLPADHVDMNVHPAKQEVRFREATRIHAFVERACHGRLAAPRSSRVELVTTGLPPLSPATSASRSAVETEITERSHGWFATTARTDPTTQKLALRLAAEIMGSAHAAEQAEMDLDEGRRRLGDPLTVLAGAFLVARSGDDLVIVDVHAAHERILFEDLKSQYARGPIVRQSLLMPVPIGLGPQATSLLAAAAPRLERLGFELDVLGPDVIALRAVPALLGHADPHRLLEAVVAHWDDEPDESILAERLFTILADVACDQAIKAGAPMGEEAMRVLLRRLEEVEGAEHCSHGRPSYVILGREAFERFFRRGR